MYLENRNLKVHLEEFKYSRLLEMVCYRYEKLNNYLWKMIFLSAQKERGGNGIKHLFEASLASSRNLMVFL